MTYLCRWLVYIAMHKHSMIYLDLRVAITKMAKVACSIEQV